MEPSEDPQPIESTHEEEEEEEEGGDGGATETASCLGRQPLCGVVAGAGTEEERENVERKLEERNEETHSECYDDGGGGGGGKSKEELIQEETGGDMLLDDVAERQEKGEEGTEEERESCLGCVSPREKAVEAVHDSGECRETNIEATATQRKTREKAIQKPKV